MVLLGGSWVLIIGVIGKVTILITLIRGPLAAGTVTILFAVRVLQAGSCCDILNSES